MPVIPGNVSNSGLNFVNLVQGPIICPKVCLPSSSVLVRPGPYLVRAVHGQAMYKLFTQILFSS